MGCQKDHVHEWAAEFGYFIVLVPIVPFTFLTTGSRMKTKFACNILEIVVNNLTYPISRTSTAVVSQEKQHSFKNTRFCQFKNQYLRACCMHPP